MPESATLAFGTGSRGLFSNEEVRKLMQVEFERAQRYSYSVACMLLRVDRIEQFQTVHGIETRDEILRALVDLVKGATRAGDLLGYVEDDRMVALFPHTAPVAAKALAERLLAGARRLTFANEARTLRITLSIGLSHNQHPGALSFETLERVAEEGAAVADAGGGDRCVETELYQLYEAKRGQDAPPAASDDEGYRARLEEKIARDGNLERAVAELADEILQRALREARAEWEEEARGKGPTPGPERRSAEGEDADGVAAYRKKIELLERRISKLSESLGLTEKELARVRQAKGVDDGLESIYRTVQGVDDEDVQKELKKALMAKIFEANFDLQSKRPA